MTPANMINIKSAKRQHVSIDNMQMLASRSTVLKHSLTELQKVSFIHVWSFISASLKKKAKSTFDLENSTLEPVAALKARRILKDKLKVGASLSSTDMKMPGK